MMMKIFNIVNVLSISFLMVTSIACTKEISNKNDVANSKNKITISANLPVSSKANFVDEGSGIKAYWSNDDSIKIVNKSVNGAKGVFYSHGNGQNSTAASFSGNCNMNSGNILYAYYPANVSVNNNGSGAALVDYSLQDGTLAYVQNHSVMCAKTSYNSNNNIPSFTLSNSQTSILRLNLEFYKDVNIKVIVVQAPRGLVTRTEMTPDSLLKSKNVSGNMVVYYDTPVSTTNKKLTIYMCAIPQTIYKLKITVRDTDGNIYAYKTSGENYITLKGGQVHSFNKSWGGPKFYMEDTPVKVGDFYYDDSTWGNILDHIYPSVLGVIFSNEPSEKDMKAGFVHGYVMALDCATYRGNTVRWLPNDYNYKENNDQKDISTIDDAIQDLDGYTHCNGYKLGTNGGDTFNSENYPSLWAAFHFGENGYGKFQNETYYNSGWYIPSLGQWYLIFKNLGGLTSDPISYAENSLYRGYYVDMSDDVAYNLNRYLTSSRTHKSGNPIDYFLGVKDPRGQKDGPVDTYYWSSTELHWSSSGYALFFIQFLKDYSSSGDPDLAFWLCLWISGKTASYVQVRCVLAF
jgi:hypothetical protein